MNDPLTNGWLQLTIAVAALLGVMCFLIALHRGTLRFPRPGSA